MSLTPDQYQHLLARLEKEAPGFESWPESRPLYEEHALSEPSQYLSTFVSQFDLQRPEAKIVSHLLTPHLTLDSVYLLMLQAARDENTEVLGECWDWAGERRGIILDTAASSQNDRLLKWVLERADFSQPKLEEALAAAVWQGSQVTVDTLLKIVKRPSGAIKILVTKGDAQRLLKSLDESWARAAEKDEAVIPDGRVLTPKFTRLMPVITSLAVERRLEKKLPEPMSNRPRIRF